jgi:hypothetical protein
MHLQRSRDDNLKHMNSFMIVKNVARLDFEHVYLEQMVSRNDGQSYEVAGTWKHKRTPETLQSAMEWVSVSVRRTPLTVTLTVAGRIDPRNQ